MNIFLFKIFATPILIGSATLAGRRWGPIVNGLIVGLPLTTGPISFILANQYGPEFAAKAASGNLAGQVSMCVFCLTYTFLSVKNHWPISAALAVTAYLLTTVVLNGVSWQLYSAFALLLFVIFMILKIIPRRPVTQNYVAPPGWDLPARMGIATIFVISLTTFADHLGPQLSGLISTFPIFGVIFAAFTHFQQGPQAASNLLRGIVLGSLSFAIFFLSIGLCLIPLGIVAAYAIASASALLISGVSYFFTNRRKHKATGELIPS